MASYSSGSSHSKSTQQATNQAQSTSFIPNYSETPILEQIAQYAGQMAPQVYQWGMQQYANNQGNIDALMRNAQSYASPQRIASDMGMAEAGVQQSGEAARQNAIKDLQSYGIDPSSGRYAALDQANRVMTGAAAAGAGNQQRISDVATGNALQNQAIASSLQNTALGYGAATAANQFAGTAMNLKYAPLGTASSSYGQSTGQSTSSSQNMSGSDDGGSSAGQNQFLAEYGGAMSRGNITGGGYVAGGGSIPEDMRPFDGEGAPGNATTGGFVSRSLSPSNGKQVDDIPAALNAGEFVIPKDVAAWKGQEFFYKLMAQARKMRATSGNGGQQGGDESPATGYADGGNVDLSQSARGPDTSAQSFGDQPASPSNPSGMSSVRGPDTSAQTYGGGGIDSGASPSAGWGARGLTGAPLPSGLTGGDPGWGARGLTGAPLPSGLTSSPGRFPNSPMAPGAANPWSNPWWQTGTAPASGATPAPATPGGSRGSGFGSNAQRGAQLPVNNPGSPNQFKFGNLNPLNTGYFGNRGSGAMPRPQAFSYGAA